MSSVTINKKGTESLESLGFKLVEVNEVTVEMTVPRGWYMRSERYLTIYDNNNKSRYEIVNFTIRES